MIFIILDPYMNDRILVCDNFAICIEKRNNVWKDKQKNKNLDCLLLVSQSTTAEARQVWAHLPNVTLCVTRCVHEHKFNSEMIYCVKSQNSDDAYVVEMQVKF